MPKSSFGSYNKKLQFTQISSDGDEQSENLKFSQEEDFLKYMEENNKESDYEQVQIETVSFIEQLPVTQE